MVENEQKEYETLDELLNLYIEKANSFIYIIIYYPEFRSSKELLNNYLEAAVEIYPEFPAFGFYMDTTSPGYFICGYKFWPNTEMLKVVCVVEDI